MLLYDFMLWTDEEWLGFAQNNNAMQMQCQNSTPCFLKKLLGNFSSLKFSMVLGLLDAKAACLYWVDTVEMNL